MIKVRLATNPLDPTQRLSNLLALVFREFAEQQKNSTVVEVQCKPGDPPVRLQLRRLPDLKTKGASRPTSRPRMTRSTTRST